MRTFHITKIPDEPPVRLLLQDIDNGKAKMIESVSLPLARLQASAAIKQLLAREIRPIPECKSCQGGVIDTGEDFVLCDNPPCREWHDMACNISDHVEVCVKADEETGVVEV